MDQREFERREVFDDIARRDIERAFTKLSCRDNDPALITALSKKLESMIKAYECLRLKTNMSPNEIENLVQKRNHQDSNK